MCTLNLNEESHKEKKTWQAAENLRATHHAVLNMMTLPNLPQSAKGDLYNALVQDIRKFAHDILERYPEPTHD